MILSFMLDSCYEYAGHNLTSWCSSVVAKFAVDPGKPRRVASPEEELGASEKVTCTATGPDPHLTSALIFPS